MLDKVMSSATSFINKIAGWLKFPTLPFSDFRVYWLQMMDSIKGWDMIFPISDILIIFGFIMAIFSALILFYIVVLIKSFIPFSGGK